VGAEDEAEGFVFLPWVAVAERAEFAFLVDFAHVIPVLGESLAGLVVTGLVGDGRVGNIEGVLEITGGVLLRDEKGVKIPEARFNET
jgi:hypothetical protein